MEIKNSEALERGKTRNRMNFSRMICIISLIMIILSGCNAPESKISSQKGFEDLDFYKYRILELSLSGEKDSALAIADRGLKALPEGRAHGILKFHKGRVFLSRGGPSAKTKGIELLRESLPYLREDPEDWTASFILLELHTFYDLGIQDSSLMGIARRGIMDSLFFSEYLGYYLLSDIQYNLDYSRDSVLANIDRAIELAGDGHPGLRKKREEYLEYYNSD